MTADRPVLGIVLMLGFCVLAPLGDGIVKQLSDTVPVLQFTTLRFALQMLLLAPVVVLARISLRMRPRTLMLTALRTLFHIGGIAMMFISLSYLPLAEAVAIAFVMPFIMLLLGRLILKEEVGARRLIACAVGFLGTLLVIQPSFEEVGLNALWPLGVALTFALFMLVTRAMAKEVAPLAIQVVSGAMACALLLPLLALAQLVPSVAPALQWYDPTGIEWSMILTVGVLGTLAHLLMTWSLRFAPAATLAPMQYLEIPFATLIGWLMFSDLPNGLAAVGICITVAAGLYVIHREQRTSRAQRAALKSPAPDTPAAP